MIYANPIFQLQYKLSPNIPSNETVKRTEKEHKDRAVGAAAGAMFARLAVGNEASSGSVFYVGGWKEGKRDGAGKYKYPNGVVYEGEWEKWMSRQAKGNIVILAGICMKENGLMARGKIYFLRGFYSGGRL